MSQPDPPPHPQIDQSQQRGGLTLGAYNRIEQLAIGDVIAGDKIVVQTLQLIVYTGPDVPTDPLARRALELAYRSEVALRYAVWRSRYATLPMQTHAQPMPSEVGQPFFEPEDLVFQTLGARLQTAKRPDPSPGDEEAPAPIIDRFTDLREGLRRYDDLLLLAPPGGGKTTALWRLALDLARDGLENPTKPLPVFVRLGGLRKGDTLDALLRRELEHAMLYDARKRSVLLPAHRQLAALLPDLLSHGRVVMLWDGLNETPSDLFSATASAIAQFRNKYPPTIHSRNTSVTTCRAEDFAALCEARGGESPLPIQQVTLLDLDIATTEALVSGRLGAERGRQLLATLAEPQHQGLRSLVRTPLLLTMLCEVFARERSIPDNRGKLLEAFVQTRWDWERQRQPDRWIGRTRQQKVLAALAYAMTAGHGRGTSVAWDWAQRVMRRVDEVLEPLELRHLAQAADLLEVLDDGQSIRFSHQLLQEYFAAIALEGELAFLEQPHLQATLRWQQKQSFWQQKLATYVAAGKRTGWEETLFLLAGLRENVAYLRELTAQLFSRPLEVAQLLHEGDSDAMLREEVRIVAQRQISDPVLSFQQRIDAGIALGLIGDLRFPVSDQEWRVSLEQRSNAFTGEGDHYWRYVPQGRYRIGGWKEGDPVADHDLGPFWVARLPVTVAQCARFVAEGYRDDRLWTPHGLVWRKERSELYLWGDSRFSGANQPVVFVSWYEATAFCRWLSAQLKAVMPQGYALRLPTEAEWEAAAAFADPETRRPYPWGEQAPTPERAVYDAWKLDAAAPVGLCPAGAAACGALDMVGNVWEWTSSSYRAYPGAAQQGQEDFTPSGVNVPFRGGGYRNNSTDVRCGARVRFPPGIIGVGIVVGFRVVLAPRLAHSF